MIVTRGDELDADLRIEMTVTNECGLRDLVLAFLRAKVGYFRCAGGWTFNAFTEIVEGMKCLTTMVIGILGLKEEAEKLLSVSFKKMS